MNDTRIGHNVHVPRYEVGNTYCAVCRAWLHRGMPDERDYSVTAQHVPEPQVYTASDSVRDASGNQVAQHVPEPSTPSGRPFLVCECGHVETLREWEFSLDCKCGGRWMSPVFEPAAPSSVARDPVEEARESHQFPTEREFQDALSGLYEEWSNRNGETDASEDFDEWKVAEIIRLRKLLAAYDRRKG